MAARLFYLPFRPALDANMKTIPGAQAWFTLPGTNTPIPVYSDAGLTTPLANPLVANAIGRWPTAYMDSALDYRLRIYDEDATVGVDTPLEDYDPYIPIDATVAVDSLPAADFYARIVTPLEHGAVADGVADDSAAFVAAEAATDEDTPIFIPAGTFRIGADLTISRRLVFIGGRLSIPNAVDVTLNGGVDAPPVQIFETSGTGAVVFSWERTAEGYMEWWGAKADMSVDCVAAWDAATKALLLTKCMGGDYLFASTPKLVWENRAVHGICSRRYQDGTDEVTRFLVQSGSEYALRIGPDAEPATLNDFQQGNDVRNLYVTRTIAPVIASACTGVRVQYTLGATLKNIKSAEHMIGFGFYGTVFTKVIDAESVRAVAGTGAGTDYWRGYWADGNADIGAAGGNASLYLIRPNYGCNLPALQTGDSQGVRADVDFTDLFIEQPEGTNCKYDIVVIGNGSTGLDVGNCDLRIRGQTSDQFHHAGLFIQNLAASGIVQIVHPYFGPTSAARASMWFDNCDGQIIVTGGELDHHSAETVQGVIIDGCKGVQLLGTAIKEHGNNYPAIGINNSDNLRIMPHIHNASVSGAEAVQLSGTVTASYIAPMVSGKASAFTKGIDVIGTTDARNEYSLSGIDSACINGGSGNKLVRNAVQITAVGATGTSYVSGVVG